MGGNKDSMRANLGPQDAALVSQGLRTSFFTAPNSVKAGAAFRSERNIQVPSGGTSSTGGEVLFETVKNCTGVHKFVLRATVPALSTVVTGGTYARLCNYASNAIFHRTSIRYTGNELATYDQMGPFLQSRRAPIGDRTMYDTIHGGNLSAAQRNTLATAKQVIELVVTVPWSQEHADEEKHILPITALANRLAFAFSIAPMTSFIQTDGTFNTTSLTLENITLRPIIVHTTAGVREELAASAHRPSGIQYPHCEFIREEIRIRPGDIGPDATSFPLRNMRGPCKSFSVVFFEVDAISGSDPAPFDIDTTLTDGISMGATSNGLSIQELQDKRENNGFFFALTHKDVSPDIGHFYLGFAAHPQHTNVASGHINASALDNLSLVIKSDVQGPAKEMIAVVIAERWQWLTLRDGNIVRNWA